MPNPFNFFRRSDALKLLAAEKEKNPKDDTSYEAALASVDTYGESRSGRRKLRGLRASGQLQDIGDWREQNKATKKATRIKKKAVREKEREANKMKRMQRRFGEMKMGGTPWIRNSRKH